MRNKSTKAFTLVELIIYVALSSIVLLIILQFSWNIFGSQSMIDTGIELEQNSRFILNQLTRDIKMAGDIRMENSVLEVDPGKLVLTMPDNLEITFDTYDKQVTLADQNFTIHKLRKTEGATEPLDLSSDHISVKNLIFYDRTRGTESKNIKIEITLSNINSTKELNMETAVSLRK